MSRTTSSSRFLIEAFVIVVSILLAFGIDAWWDEQRERSEEAEVLAGLHREFEEYRDVLNRRIELHAEILSAITAVLESTEAGAWVSMDWDMDSAIGRALSPPTTNLGGGVRDALVQAGRLELLSDPTLRERLAAWPGFYEEVLDDEIFARELVFGQMLPFLTRRGLHLSAALKRGAMPEDQEWPTPVHRIADDATDAENLLGDPEFRALFEVRYAFWNHTGLEYQIALEAAEEILALLETRK